MAGDRHNAALPRAGAPPWGPRRVARAGLADGVRRGAGLGQVEQQILRRRGGPGPTCHCPRSPCRPSAPTLHRRTGPRGRRTSSCPGSWPASCTFAIGYTEPEAGTDLAAPADAGGASEGGWVGGRGTTYVVNGQKIFTTGGHDARLHSGLACPHRPRRRRRHRGISILIVDTVRSGATPGPPIITHDGAHHVNATYLPPTSAVPRNDAGRGGETPAGGWLTTQPQPRAGDARARRAGSRPCYDRVRGLGLRPGAGPGTAARC